MINSLTSFFSQPWVLSTFATLAVISTLLIITIIISENRNPVKSLAWVTILLLLPMVGLVLYLFFGRNLKNTRMISRKKRRKLRNKQTNFISELKNAGLSEHSLSTAKMARSLSGAQLYLNNNIDVFSNGTSKFEALKKDLREAQQSIYLQYYIIADDNLGNQIADILIERAKAGIDVKVIYDHVGSFSTSNAFFRRLKEANVDANPFFRVLFRQFGTRVNWRNHRKIVIIDNSIGYVGGMNIADRYINGGKFNQWRDTHTRITGPAVIALAYSFAIDWNFMGRGLINISSNKKSTTEILSQNTIQNVAAQLLTSGPTYQWSNFSITFTKLIASARKRVYIQTPYFLPTDGLLKALQSASMAHIDVRIMIPSISDSKMLTYSSNSYLAECMQAGIKIYRYNAGMLHSKMIIIDDEFVTIGSANFDFRSFDYNFEANLLLYSTKLNESMVSLFKADQAECERLHPAKWRKRPTKTKIAESILRLLSPIL